MSQVPSTSESPASAENRGKAKHRWRTRSGRSAWGGAAVVARGEPMVWLAAGALATCVAMIVGLLVLLFARGVVTFWPQPIVRFELADGTVHMGEVTRDESFELTPAMVEEMPEPIAERARKLLGDATSVQSHRELVRTGNYQLTEKHFDWVEDFAVAERDEPEWAVILERLEWGRFYGMPLRYETRHPRTPSGEEERLSGLLFFFGSGNVDRADEEDRQALREVVTDPAVVAALDEVRERLAETRTKRNRAFRDELAKATTGGTLVAEVEGVGDVPWAEYEDGSGTLLGVRETWDTPAGAWERFRVAHPEARARYAERRTIEKDDIGEVNRREEEARLRIREAELDTDASLLAPVNRLDSLNVEIDGYETAVRENEEIARRARQLVGEDSPLVAAAETVAKRINVGYERTLARLRAQRDKIDRLIAETPPEARNAVDEYVRVKKEVDERTAQLRSRIDEINAENERQVLVMQTAQGQDVPIVVRDVVRGYPANQLTSGEKWGVYWSRWGEYLTDDPRFANQEGGVYPAIWGTVAMTVIMSLAVVPFGVLAALYLREYARAGPIVSAVRIAVNNLAGVPSIVFGVFGLGFFCYIIGAYVDGGPVNAGLTPLPSPTWYALLAVLAVTATGAFFLGLASLGGPSSRGRSWKTAASRSSFVLWITATVLLFVLLARMPGFEGLFRARLPNPTFGKGGLLWASLTLALLTLPVVIVATEEALAAVPNSMREGSYACGASKWQTIRRIVLPRAMPGITTGMILAMARGAGEVAPLMLVGALKLAPELPVDGIAPFVHLERSFMHLGFHIYDLGFQSQNSEAAKPMVFTTTLLLIGIVAFLNVAAILLRARLRRKFKGSQF